MLTVENLTKQYPTRGESLDVLRGVSLTVESGHNTAILGPSGSGKSTLLSIIGGLEQPTSGTVTLEGQNPNKLDDLALAAFRNVHIGFVFQEHYLLPQCSVLENVLIPTVAAGKTKREAVERAKSLIDAQLGFPNASIIGPANSPAANASGRPLPARSSISPRCCWPTNPRATSTAPTPTASATCSWNCKNKKA